MGPNRRVGASRRRDATSRAARVACAPGDDGGGRRGSRARAAVRALARAVDDWDDDVDDVDDTSDDSHPNFDDSRSTRVTTSSDARAIRDAAVGAGDFPAAAKFALILPRRRTSAAALSSPYDPPRRTWTTRWCV